MAPGVAPECCGPAWRLPSGAWVPSPLYSQQVHLGSVVQQEGCLLQDKGRGGGPGPPGGQLRREPLPAPAPACPSGPRSPSDPSPSQRSASLSPLLSGRPWGHACLFPAPERDRGLKGAFRLQWPLPPQDVSHCDQEG